MVSTRCAYLLRTRGSIESVRVHGGRLEISGWVLLESGEPVEGFSLHAVGGELRGVEVEFGLPSEDVALAHADLPGSDEARFLVHVALESAEFSPRSDMLWLHPRHSGRDGMAMFWFPSDHRPRLSEQDANVVGGGLDVGNEVLNYLLHYAEMTREERVLDVGCGVGRIAFPLSYYLSDRARYEGFDVVENSIARAKTVVGEHRTGFGFRVANLKNLSYRRDGVGNAAEFEFPYADVGFSVVIVTSVFTHMSSSEVLNYIHECSRVLREGGKILVTAFLLDEEVRGLIDRGVSAFSMSVPRGNHCFAESQRDLDQAVGFDRATFVEWFRCAGLHPCVDLPGSWCGRDEYTSYQDILVFEK